MTQDDSDSVSSPMGASPMVVPGSTDQKREIMRTLSRGDRLKVRGLIIFCAFPILVSCGNSESESVASACQSLEAGDWEGMWAASRDLEEDEYLQTNMRAASRPILEFETQAVNNIRSEIPGWVDSLESRGKNDLDSVWGDCAKRVDGFPAYNSDQHEAIADKFVKEYGDLRARYSVTD